MPRLIHGSSSLGNLYGELPSEVKLELVRQWMLTAQNTESRQDNNFPSPVCIDSAGKYGAGLALEEIGKALRELEVPADRLFISNKLGWQRTKLLSSEPTFEPGVWVNIGNDARQCIGASGILECYRQGNELLGHPYRAQLVSVHDPDEYLARADSPEQRRDFLNDIVQAYGELIALRDAGEVRAVGIGAKDWKVIREICSLVDLDWVMFANSFTLYSHPLELARFIEELSGSGVSVVNSAVFHSGFLAGSDYFDYQIITRRQEPDKFAWRDSFFATCQVHGVRPVDACIEFALMLPGVSSISLNTAKPERVVQNQRSVHSRAPQKFWSDMRSQGLISIGPGDFS